MSERFKSNKNKKLQNAYGVWASKKDDKQIIAICLNDPEHEMAAFFGIAKTGKKVCVVSSDMIKILDKRYTVLRKKKNPSNLSINISKTNNFVTFTSGSTKKPKAILRSHKSWIYSFNKNGVLKSDTVAALGHLSHSLTLYTIIYATPTLLKLVYKNNIIYPKVRKIFIGGGTFNDLDRDFCQQRFPNAEIKVFYGTAETSFITISDNKTPPNSVGLAYEGVKLEIINGRVFVTTPMIAENYLDEEISMNVYTPFSTGEIGHIDNDGFLFLDGRLDRAVNISDKIVHLDTLENDLMSLSGIKYAAVITIPDAKRGQKAFAAVYGGIASHPQISGIINLKEWPLLLSGKTDYIKVTALIKEAFYEK